MSIKTASKEMWFYKLLFISLLFYQTAGAAETYMVGIEEDCVVDLPEPQNAEVIPEDCSTLSNGVHMISPTGSAENQIEVACNDNWIVLQRRGSGGTVNFDQKFTKYEDGFGNKQKDHWLGLKNMNTITATGNWKLRVDLQDFKGAKKWAEYTKFKIAKRPQYKLNFQNMVPGSNAGNGLQKNKGKNFSAKDKNQMTTKNYNCAGDRGAWWYPGSAMGCGDVNLNAKDLKPGTSTRNAHWLKFKSMRKTTMKIKKM